MGEIGHAAPQAGIPQGRLVEVQERVPVAGQEGELEKVDVLLDDGANPAEGTGEKPESDRAQEYQGVSICADPAAEGDEAADEADERQEHHDYQVEHP